MPIALPERTATAAQALTPRQIVAELDRHVVGQARAKRAVAIALRNRMRRQQLSADMAAEVTPKNILMIGPTGVGKTGIASGLLLKALQNVSLEIASMTLTAYMLCGAVGMFVGGFVAAQYPRWSDRVVASCMTVAALCMALCASGVFGATGTLVVLAATGFAVGVGGPSRDLMIKNYDWSKVAVVLNAEGLIK